jgi:hypothetical protein
VLQPVEKVPPFTVHAESSHHFGMALHDAVVTSVNSMDALHDCLTPCVDFLKRDGVGPVQMILSIKACVLAHARLSADRGNEFAVGNANLLMEHIIKWAIVDYYRCE